MNNKIAEIKVSYSNNSQNKTVINNSNDTYKVLIKNWDLKTIELLEDFKMILLNRANEILGIHHLSKGGTYSTLIDVKLLFSISLKCNAHSIIIAHNHPSGNLQPSKADIDITKKIKNASKLLDIKILDHLIISNKSYYSFLDEGIL